MGPCYQDLNTADATLLGQQLGVRQQFYWAILARNGVTPIAVHVKRHQLIRPRFHFIG